MREGLRSRTNVNGIHSSEDAHGAIATGVETSSKIEKTDYTQWRLKVEHGRQTWHYITPKEAETWPQRVPEKYHLGIETVYPSAAKSIYGRDFRNLLRQRQFARRQGMECRFILRCRRMMDIGLVSMEDRCFLFRDLLLRCILVRHRFLRSGGRRSLRIWSRKPILLMAGGEFIHIIRVPSSGLRWITFPWDCWGWVLTILLLSRRGTDYMNWEERSECLTGESSGYLH